MKRNLAYELTVAVLATADAFLRESQRLLRPLGLSGAQFNVLNILSDQPSGLSQRELGDRLVVDRSNVTGLLDRMSKAGWVRRQDDPADRRIYRVTLTPSGRKLWEQAFPLYLSAAADVTSGLPLKQKQETLDALEKLKAAASRWQPDDAKAESRK